MHPPVNPPNTGQLAGRNLQKNKKKKCCNLKHVLQEGNKLHTLLIQCSL